ncbi:lytic transglycosylase domain-containing protein [Hydrogenibacillus schlegelii]|uniref:Transglycosylase SLT domain-containing protein n=1 Tax=Hydrogenibacillus schlegelii TaxID=1484 RepID=A0A132NAV7_HYDSH|nr:lytic transglycosylase domain-containing protein [Hydrogenibacillus schlegelii]KWX07248.1 hypothetical protein TR75_03600 [Hydrogenibacillus schlegelii]OAR03332.1 hypothetical protein SA87_04055 [Hydrogenibacillus schlegelii]
MLLRRILLSVLFLLVLALAVRLPPLWRWMYPLDYPDAIRRAAREAAVDPALIAAVIRAESGFVHGAASEKGARGLMQLLDDTRRYILGRTGYDRRLSPEELGTPEADILLGSLYLRYLLDRYGGNTLAALAAYNAGEGRVDRWLKAGVWDGTARRLGDIPFGETRHYLLRVLYLETRYRQVHGARLGAGS